MRRRLASLIGVLLLAVTLTSGASGAVSGGQGRAGSAVWRSAPFEYLGHPDAYTMVQVGVIDQRGFGVSGAPDLVGIGYVSEIRVPARGGGAFVLQQVVAPFASVDVRFSPSVDGVLVPEVTIPMTTWTDGVWPPVAGELTISISMQATGGWEASHDQQWCIDPRLWCANNVGRTRPASADVQVDGVSLGVPSDASLRWYTGLARPA